MVERAYIIRINSEARLAVHDIEQMAEMLAEISERVEREMYESRSILRLITIGEAGASVEARLRRFGSMQHQLERDRMELERVRTECQVRICRVLALAMVQAKEGLVEDVLAYRTNARQRLSGLISAMEKLPRRFPTPAAALTLVEFGHLLASHNVPAKTSAMRRMLRTISERI